MPMRVVEVRETVEVDVGDSVDAAVAVSVAVAVFECSTERTEER